MSTYKITNITHLAGKRDFKHNSVLDITVVNGMIKDTMKLKPDDSVYLTVNSLPLSVHRLRVKGLVTVVEVSPSDIPKKRKASKSKAQKNTEAVESKKTVTPKKSTSKKRSTTKKTTSEKVESENDSVE